MVTSDNRANSVNLLLYVPYKMVRNKLVIVSNASLNAKAENEMK